MRSGLERIGKSIDANVEKDGAKEINWDDKDSYAYLFDEEELEKLKETEDEFYRDTESAAIRKGIEESKEELWNATDLGKHTIGTPTPDKCEAKSIEDLEMEKILEKAVAELEGIF